MNKVTVTLAGQEVELTVPPFVSYFRVSENPIADYPTRAASLLRLCWAGKDRPAHRADAKEVEATGVAVIEALHARGATQEEISKAMTAAAVLCYRAFNPEPLQEDAEDEPAVADLEETADFLGKTDGG